MKNAQEQLTLLNAGEYFLDDKKRKKKTLNKRVRYKKPTYTKSYSFYSINPDTNEIQYLGDEKHIFRIKVLHCIYSGIFNELVNLGVINILEQFETKEHEGLVIFRDKYDGFEYKEAIIKGTELMSLKEQLKIHINFLRNLRKGLTIKEALCLKV